MNKELDTLAKEYAQNKDEVTLSKIFKALKSLLKKKADFVFYQREFHEGKTIRYIVIKPENKKIAIKEHNFKLSETGQTTIEDVKQDLYVAVMKIINNYDSEQDFKTYLISSLWNYTPSFVNSQFLSSLKHSSANIIDEDGNEKSLVDDIAQPQINKELNIFDSFENLTELDKKVIKTKIDFPYTTQAELAEMIGVTQQRVCQIIKGLKKKYIADTF